jgi:hypothetical protein
LRRPAFLLLVSFSREFFPTTTPKESPMFSAISNFITRNDIDYADVLMLSLVSVISIPAIVLAGYGIYASIGLIFGS